MRKQFLDVGWCPLLVLPLQWQLPGKELFQEGLLAVLLRFPSHSQAIRIVSSINQLYLEAI
jgi:hypothetical protein